MNIRFGSLADITGGLILCKGYFLVVYSLAGDARHLAKCLPAGWVSRLELREGDGVRLVKIKKV
jgi:hypothetical protein